jgi:hypothetical protein
VCRDSSSGRRGFPASFGPFSAGCRRPGEGRHPNATGGRMPDHPH